ncbi:MAG: PIG-L family deacetylase [Actinobacteria bacterium]|nr:PIG-L family deacetylase [Actinomycetota bacterium]MCL6104430.1 PIG-L family deacetylase [Actinomycetota bacterium]
MQQGQKHLDLSLYTSVLAVCAHPDDESFGLGAVLLAFADQQVETAVLCFTHGELSTLGVSTVTADEVADIRAHEFEQAALRLNLAYAELLDYPDGQLNRTPVHELSEKIISLCNGLAVDALLVFDVGGITGHPDHEMATQAALYARDTIVGFPDIATPDVLGWVVPLHVGEKLNTELGTKFIGRTPTSVEFVLEVPHGLRERQWEAIKCHKSQVIGNAVLPRRLELQGGYEWLKKL